MLFLKPYLIAGCVILLFQNLTIISMDGDAHELRRRKKIIKNAFTDILLYNVISNGCKEIGECKDTYQTRLAQEEFQRKWGFICSCGGTDPDAETSDMLATRIESTKKALYETVSTLIAQSVDINYCNPLSVAIGYKEETIVKQLLDAGAKPSDAEIMHAYNQANNKVILNLLLTRATESEKNNFLSSALLHRGEKISITNFNTALPYFIDKSPAKKTLKKKKNQQAPSSKSSDKNVIELEHDSDFNSD